MRHVHFALLIILALSLTSRQASAKEGNNPLGTGFVEGGYEPSRKEGHGAFRTSAGFGLSNGFGLHGYLRYLDRVDWAATGGIIYIRQPDKNQNLHLAIDVGAVGVPRGSAKHMVAAAEGMWTHWNHGMVRLRLEMPVTDPRLSRLDYESDLTVFTPMLVGGAFKASKTHGIGSGMAFGKSVFHVWALWVPLNPHGDEIFMPKRFSLGATVSY